LKEPIELFHGDLGKCSAQSDAGAIEQEREVLVASLDGGRECVAMALASEMSKTCSLTSTPNARAAAAFCARGSALRSAEGEMAAAAREIERDGSADTARGAGNHGYSVS
jgi:hypothetical protein